MVKALLLHELQQVLELLFGFAGVANDEGGAQHRIGQLLSDALQQLAIHPLLPGPIHRPQHLRVAVLQRQIQVGQHVGHLAVGRQHLGGESCGVGVMHPNPGDFHLPQGPQQFR